MREAAAAAADDDRDPEDHRPVGGVEGAGGAGAVYNTRTRGSLYGAARRCRAREQAAYPYRRCRAQRENVARKASVTGQDAVVHSKGGAARTDVP